MNDINDVIKNRRSVFPAQYSGGEVSEAFVRQLLENANWAPTHRFTEPWRFKVMQGDSKARLGQYLADTYTDITPDDKFSPFKLRKIKNNCEAASCIIGICMQRDDKERVPEWEEIASTAMAVQNMWLTCTAHQIGSYWSTPPMIQYMSDFFELEEGERCLGFFYIGTYNSDEVEFLPKREPVQGKVTWIS